MGTVDMRRATPVAVPETHEKPAAARAYLAQTDWYVIRAAETGKAVPASIAARRARARKAAATATGG